jgi:hypothetical protein
MNTTTLLQIDAAYDALLGHAQLSNATKLKLLRAKADIEPLKKAHEARMQELSQQHQAAVTALQAEYEAKAQALAAQLQAARAKLFEEVIVPPSFPELPEEEFTAANAPASLLAAAAPLLPWIKATA